MFTAPEKEKEYMQRNEAYMTLLEMNTKQNKTNKQTKKQNLKKKKVKIKTENLVDLLNCWYGKKQRHTAAPKKTNTIPSLPQVLICMC